MKVPRNSVRLILVILILVLGIVSVSLRLFSKGPKSSLTTKQTTTSAANENLSLTLYIYDANNYDSPKDKKTFTFSKEDYEKRPTETLNTMFADTGIKLSKVSISKTDKKLVADLTEDTADNFDKGSAIGITLTNQLIMTLLHLPDVEKVQVTVNNTKNLMGNHFNFNGVFTLSNDGKYKLSN